MADSVMIIEDDLGLQFLYSTFLIKAGFKILNQSSSAEKALTYYFQIKEKPQIIISDYHIQGEKTGVDVALSILMANPTQKFLFMTSDQSLVARIRHSEILQHFPVLRKPFAMSDLIYALNHLAKTERKVLSHEKDHFN